MASILSWANKAVHTVGHDVNQAAGATQRAASRTYDQLNPLDNGRTWQNPQGQAPQQQAQHQAAPSLFQQLTHNGLTNAVGRDIAKPIAHIPTAVDRYANQSALGRGLQTVGLGALRSGIGTAQAFSGLYDLATPGVGTNRFSKGAVNLGKQVDATAKAEHSNGLLYHGSQTLGDALTFAAGGSALKGVSAGAKAIPGASKTLGIVSKANNAVTKQVASKTAGLAEKNFGGRVAAKTIQNVANPKYQAVNAGFTALQTGKDAAQGRKTTPLGVGTNLAIGGVGFPVAGAVTHEVAAPAIKAGTNALRDAHLIAPSKLNKSEVGNLAAYRNQMNTGAITDENVYNKGVAAAQKAGIAHTDTQAIDNLLGAHRTFDVRMQGRKDALNKFAQDHPLGLTSGAVDENGNKLGLNGKPLNPSAATPTVPQGKAQRAVIPTIGQTGKVDVPALTKNKTGIVDKQLNDLQQVHKQLVNAEADNIRPIHQPTAALNPVAAKVRAAGGISSSAYEDMPKSVMRKGGMSADRVAQELGYNSEDELMNALHTEADAKARTLTEKQLKQQALENLQNGTSQHSEDFAQLQQMLKQRQDELSRYPTGARKQVKVLPQPAKMTDAELQSLAQTPEGMAKKTTNKVTDRNEKIALRNPEAERAVQEILKKGGSSDEALNAYISATGTDLQTAVKDVKRVANESNLGFNGGKNPLAGTIRLPEVQKGDHNQAFLNADYVKQHEQAVGQKALDSFNGLSEHDKTLLKDIEKDTVSNVSKKAENPQAFLDAEKNIRTYYDTRHAYDHALGIDVGYRANYLRQLFNKAEDVAATADQQSIAAGNKRPGYTQQRSYDTLNTHVGQALERDIAGSSSNHAKLAYSEGLHQAYPDKVNASGQLVRGENGNYLQLTNKYGQGITADKEVANQINSRSRSETTSKGLQRYDKVNAGLKYVKLGGGAFHAVTEAGNFIGQQMVSGKFFTEPGSSGKVLKTFFSPKTMEREMNTLRDNGTLDKAALSGLKIMAKDILADANVNLRGKLSKYTGMQALHDATFQREIPYAKLKVFEQKTRGLDVHNPADLQKMRSISQGINDLYGGINRDIHGIKPNEFKVLQRFVLATDFTEGKIKTALNTVNITDRSPAANLARQAVLGKVLLFAGLASGAGALTGEYQGKSGTQIAKDIAGKLLDPKFKMGDYSVAFPSTHVAEFTRPVMPLFKGTNGSGKTATVADRLKGLQKYGTNRLAAVPSEALQLITNKDAMGNRIYGKDYAFKGGEQISKGKALANVAGGFVPIPASQGIGVATGKTNVAAGIANTIGLRATNDTQFNQNATPVKLGNGANIPKDQAVTFNQSVADQRKKLGDQLKATDAYKNASPDVQKKKLATLNADITSSTKRTYSVKDNVPLDKQATKAEQAVLSGKLPDSLTKGSSKVGAGNTGSKIKVNSSIDPHSQKVLNEYNTLDAATKKSKAYGENDYDYKVAQAKFDNSVANNSLSTAQRIEKQAALKKEALGAGYVNGKKVNAGYSKETRELYGVGRNALTDYLASDPKGTEKAKQLVAYDQALTDAGLQAKNKYKNGLITATATKGGSTGRKTGSRSTKAKIPKIGSIKTPHMKTFKSKQFKVAKLKSPSFKNTRAKMPTYTAAIPKVTSKKKAVA